MTEPRVTWTCEISGPGKHGDLPDGADFPMRQAVRLAFHETTGADADHLSSGWGRPAGVHLGDEGLRAALESVIRLIEPIPYSVDVEQAGMQAEVAIEAARAALASVHLGDEGLDVNRLARAHHAAKTPGRDFGCGWVFGSVDGEGNPLCPCVAEAEAIAAAYLTEGDSR